MTSPIVKLTREIRLQLPHDGTAAGAPVRNSWAGWPKTTAFAPFVRLRCTVAGPVEVPVGYVSDVKAVDQAVRDVCTMPLLEAAVAGSDPGVFVGQLFERVSAQFAPPLGLHSLTLCVTPYQSLTVFDGVPTMTILTHQFEFSAAHRLHCEDLSDEENRRLFGKCNSPNGHGHNYVLDVSVERSPSTTFDLSRFESTVVETAITLLDHKHLNVDVPQFRELNPTVENIASVIWELLSPHVEGLHRVRVYETAKTWADVSAAG